MSDVTREVVMQVSGRNSTGPFVVESAGRLFGPFDGKHPAEAFRSELRRAGVSSNLVKVWTPRQAREALPVHREVLLIAETTSTTT